MRLLLAAALLACGGREEPPPPPFVPQQGPIVWLEAEDDPTDGALDSSGGGFSAFCEADECPELKTGRVGSGYHFDGIDDRLRIPWDPRLDTTHSFTISMWLHMEGVDERALIARKYGDDPMEHTYIVLQTLYCSPQEDRLFFATNDIEPICGVFSIDINGWSHFAATWDGGLKRFFIDGQVAGSEPTSVVEFDQHDILIGGNIRDGRFITPVKGTLDDIRIYERALEPSEVNDLPGFPL